MPRAGISFSVILKEITGIPGWIPWSCNALKKAMLLSPFMVFKITSGLVVLMSSMIVEKLSSPKGRYFSPTISPPISLIWSLIISFAARGKI